VETFPSLSSELWIPTFTEVSGRGAWLSFKVKVAVPPPSVVTNPEAGDTMTCPLASGAAAARVGSNSQAHGRPREMPSRNSRYRIFPFISHHPWIMKIPL
jgi:hypothetical protein